MHRLRIVFQAAVLGFLGFTLGTSIAVAQTPSPQILSADLRQQFTAEIAKLNAAFKELPDQARPAAVDAAIFLKGAQWALDYDREFSKADVDLIQKSIARAGERLSALRGDKPTWRTRHGKVALGYVSKIDQSTQPYGLIVPRNYDSTRPIRLDVVLHGSTRPVGLSELRFMSRFDEGDAETAKAPDQAWIELHPLGRVENCYRWAGETDVFEAIEDVCQRYQIDRDRIVLRGMSMGASGTWHLGLKHPDRFVALGPYCGYVDTHRFSETPLPNFVKVGPLPEHQELGLHMLDSVDYAANAGVVPAIACMGEKDVFFDAHVIMGQAFEREGLKLVNLISPGTGHVVDPVTHAEQMRRISEYVNQGLNHHPTQLRFVTWTLKYSRCHWLQILGLERHYKRAEFSAALKDDILQIAEPLNITRFAIQTEQLSSRPKGFRIGSQELSIPLATGKMGTPVIVERCGSQWRITEPDTLAADQVTQKRPGLQGPIDDAFTTPFLCVRGTGKAWNPQVQGYSDARLKQFADEWRHYFRGDLPVKDDTEVTEEDVRTRNLILFGDPGSNSWMKQVLPHLPFSWSPTSVIFAGEKYSAADHLPAVILPNPLPGAAGRYVVLNSGHTFREAELNKLNYLLFPRWGDWSILQIGPQPTGAGQPEEKVIQAGFLNEQWKLPNPQK